MPSVLPVWARFADAVLAREAALCRVVSGVPPRDVPGAYITDEDLDTLLRSLPGLDGPLPGEVAEVHALLDPLVELGRARLEAWRERDDDPLARMVRTARVTSAETEVLALVAAVEVDPQRQRLVAYVQDSVHLPRLHLGTLVRILGRDHPGARTVAPGSALCRAELVSVETTGPWATRTCALPARAAWAVGGDDSPDPDLPAGTATRPALRHRADDVPLPPTVVLVHGSDAETRRLAASAVRPSNGSICSPVPATDEAWRALVREAVVGDRTVVLEVAETVDAVAAQWIDRTTSLTWVVSSRRELPVEDLPSRPWQEVYLPDGTALDSDWVLRLGVPAPPGSRLTREQLRLVTAAAGGDPAHVDAGIRRLSGGHLDHLALRIRPRRSWSELVLPDHQSDQLRQVVTRHRGKATVFGDWGFAPLPSTGTVALFAGPSGTGKTLAAEVVAAELGVDLYKVDISSVVSKYIGETEKNLDRIFDAAEAGDLVLFFDEADALFGKRSEVSSSHDRYANIEVAYLLQRLEGYDGLVVLATNLQRNIDEAFLRRISVSITFPSPDEEQRRRIWSLVFPARAPVEDLDVDFLARQFAVPGGVIRSAALTAAFMAADAGEPITMERVAVAMKREFAKLGRLSTESEFDRYFDVVAGG